MSEESAIVRAPCYAHTLPGRPPSDWEPLERHLDCVARRATRFASVFGAAELGEVTGRWHDLGKYRQAFQDYLAVASTASESGEDGTATRIDHSTAGAIYAFRTLGRPLGDVVAYLIAGHHAGLPDAVGGEASLRARLDRAELLEDTLRSLPPASVLAKPQSVSVQPPSKSAPDVHFWIRMLFSALVDADFLETEVFLDPARAMARAGPFDLAPLRAALRVHLEGKLREASGPMASLRAEVLSSCRERASESPGIFSLTVPTGGGKTLSSLAFALEHAAAHGMRRIIYVIPYTSILEQTADVFREVFGPDAVVEHHSNLAPERDDERHRLAAENWDAPIVVTTNVQFFESLFASRTSRCRKLHNIARSVVVLDEVQLLPPEYLEPIRTSLGVLARDFGVTALLCTATQPALLGGVREVVADPEQLSRRLERVRVEWPRSESPETWESLAARLSSHDKVLCVVNRRDDARELVARMPTDAVHLSALMCGEHRSQTIRRIRETLREPTPLRVVSTQLVEAGVDVDFPVVYRAFAGLDSIAQAAGRCNREGRLEGGGSVIVFHPPRPAPPGLLRKAETATRELAAIEPELILSPLLFRRFFEVLYAKVSSLDREGILDLLGRDAADLDIQFRTAAARFRLVDESDYRPVIVTWGGGAELVRRLRVAGPSRALLRRLQRFTVNLPERQLLPLLTSGEVAEIADGFFVQQRPNLYHDRFGLLTESPEYEPEELTV